MVFIMGQTQLRNFQETTVGGGLVPIPGAQRIANYSTSEANWTRFVNHSCRPNVKAIQIQVGKVRMMAFYTLKSIRAAEQIFINYGKDYFNDAGVVMRCQCPAKNRHHNAVGPDEELSEDDDEPLQEGTYSPPPGFSAGPAKTYNLRRRPVVDYNKRHKLPRRSWVSLV
ncbi:hypothetical protein QBC44DRAFT_367848 [Cladorrhinum sp. PSN332]|nr:hypothetical protein QBC44DRAFT_367848 [Cladorrhinum sp. PSN332]